MKQIGLAFLGMAFLLGSCHDRPAESKAEAYEQHGDTLIVAARSGLHDKIKEETLNEQSYHPELLTGGIVRAIPNQYAVIAAPFAGRIVKSYTSLGMKVRAGAPLFELSSPDFVMAQKMYFQAKTEYSLADKKLKRQQNLLANGVGTQKELEEAQALYDIEQKDLENASLGIRLFKADPDKLVFGQSLVVRSPIAGNVIEDKIVVGQFVKNDDGGVAKVAELSKVWVAGQVKEKDMGLIRSMEQCEITIASLPGKPIKGTIRHIDGFVNEETRSVEVLVECANLQEMLKPGMYVNVGFINASVSTILIPAKSVLQQSNSSFVFKRVASGKYVRQPVRVKAVENGQSVVQSGLAKNDIIISEGAYFLAAAK